MSDIVISGGGPVVRDSGWGQISGDGAEMTNVHVQGLFMVVALDPLPFELL